MSSAMLTESESESDKSNANVNASDFDEDFMSSVEDDSISKVSTTLKRSSNDNDSSSAASRLTQESNFQMSIENVEPEVPRFRF